MDVFKGSQETGGASSLRLTPQKTGKQNKNNKSKNKQQTNKTKQTKTTKKSKHKNHKNPPQKTNMAAVI